MQMAQQFSIYMVNKPGVMAKVLGQFAQAKINIIAITMMDSVEHGVMRIVFDNPNKAREILQKLNLPFNETGILSVTLNNESGALASVAEKLSKNHINISYAYCTAGAKGGRTTGVFKVTNVDKAMKILEKNHKKETKSKPVVRRAKSAKR